MSQQNGMV